jgi:hypothetical protein
MELSELYSKHTITQLHDILCSRCIPCTLVSYPLIMNSPSGWFIGQVLRGPEDENDALQLWTRLTDYMTEATAIAIWDRDYAPSGELS